jgi:hypothetical protein
MTEAELSELNELRNLERHIRAQRETQDATSDLRGGRHGVAMATYAADMAIMHEDEIRASLRRLKAIRHLAASAQPSG